MATKQKQPTTKPIKKIGRPTGYTDTMGELICHRLINGESLNAMCRDDDMPAVGMVFRWLADNRQFREWYTVARQMQADVLADAIIELADNAQPDNVAVVKMQIDARKWYASKIAPTKYSDRTEITGAGGKDLIRQPVLNIEQGTTPEQIKAMLDAVLTLDENGFNIENP